MESKKTNYPHGWNTSSREQKWGKQRRQSKTTWGDVFTGFGRDSASAPKLLTWSKVSIFVRCCC